MRTSLLAMCWLLSYALGRMLIDMTTPKDEHSEHDSSHESVFASYEAELEEIAAGVAADRTQRDDRQSYGQPERPRTWSALDDDALDESGSALDNGSGWAMDFSEVDPALLTVARPRRIALVAWIITAFFFNLLLVAWMLPSFVGFDVPGWLGPLGTLGFLATLVAAVIASASRGRAAHHDDDDGARL